MSAFLFQQDIPEVRQYGQRYDADDSYCQMHFILSSVETDHALSPFRAEAEPLRPRAGKASVGLTSRMYHHRDKGGVKASREMLRLYKDVLCSPMTSLRRNLPECILEKIAILLHDKVRRGGRITPRPDATLRTDQAQDTSEHPSDSYPP